jgi:hypothetical protein
MMNVQNILVFLPPPLSHEKMYPNHLLYNELIAFLHKHSLGWISHTISTLGKRSVYVMTKALFQCGPSVWIALNDNHNNGALHIVLSSLCLHLFANVYPAICSCSVFYVCVFCVLCVFCFVFRFMLVYMFT